MMHIKIIKIFILISIFIFNFNLTIKADSSNDFEIDEISIGDSLFNILDTETIKKDTQYFYENLKFGTVALYNSSTYDRVQLTYDVESDDYAIHGVAGILKFPDNIEKCRADMKKIANDVKSLFGEEAINRTGSFKRSHDKSGKSLAFYNDFQFKDNSAINIYCTDWSEKMTKENGWIDELKISIYSKEFSNFLSE